MPSSMIDNVALLRTFSAPSADLSLGMIGMENGGNLFTHTRNQKTITRNHLVRNFLGVKPTAGNGQLGNVCWLPGTGNPADGLNKVKSKIALSLRTLQSGPCYSSLLRQLEGASPQRRGCWRYTYFAPL